MNTDKNHTRKITDREFIKQVFVLLLSLACMLCFTAQLFNNLFPALSLLFGYGYVYIAAELIGHVKLPAGFPFNTKK